MSNLELPPNELPSQLAQFLKDQSYACLTQATDQGTVLVLKAPGREIESARGPVPIRLRHEIYQHPVAPVIRLLVTIYDQPLRPLAFEAFINVDDPQQHDDFAALTTQTELPLLFYDEQLRHRLTKVIGLRDPASVFAILQVADQLLAQTPPEHFNFDQAKAVVQRTIPL